ncbi:MAG: hypothetical protein KF768_13335 [Phycisphaeraceae bacterium]|nr:hypothetical protein [Phycisphaeraceae bacterium]
MQEQASQIRAEPGRALRPAWLSDALVERWRTGSRLLTVSTAGFAGAVLTSGLVLAWRWQETDAFGPSDGGRGPSVWSVAVWGMVIAAGALRLAGWWRLTEVSPLLDSGPLRPVAWRFCRALGLAAGVTVIVAVVTRPGESPSVAEGAVAGLIRLAALGLIAGHALCGWLHIAGTSARLGDERLARSAWGLIAVALAGAAASFVLFARAAMLMPGADDRAAAAALLAMIVTLCAAMLTLVMEQSLVGRFDRAVRG